MDNNVELDSLEKIKDSLDHVAWGMADYLNQPVFIRKGLRKFMLEEIAKLEKISDRIADYENNQK